MAHTVRAEFSLASNQWTPAALPALDSQRTLVLAFGAPSLVDNPAPLRALRAQYPRSHIVGCSTAGEINGTSVKDDTLSVAVTQFDATDLLTEVVRVKDAAESHAAGLQLGQALARRPGLRAVFVLSEGLKVNGSELVRGCNEAVGGGVVVTGGLSGDGARFQRTWVAAHDEVGAGLVAAVGFYGSHIVVTHGSRGGWDQFGPERMITKSAGNVIHEIDEQPALHLYKKYLGDKAKDLPGSGLLFPLEMRRDEGDTKPLVRTLLAVDESSQSLTFAGDTPQGHRVRLMKANFDRLVEGAQTAATHARPGHEVGDGGCLAIAVSCVGRRLVLGARIEEEVEAIQAALPKGTEIVGFYSYGELSPYVAGEPCELHNQTMTVTMFSESPVPLAKPALAARITPAAVTVTTSAPTAGAPASPSTSSAPSTSTSSTATSSAPPAPAPPASPAAVSSPPPAPPAPAPAAVSSAPRASTMPRVPVQVPAATSPLSPPAGTPTSTPLEAAGAVATAPRPPPPPPVGLASTSSSPPPPTTLAAPMPASPGASPGSSSGSSSSGSSSSGSSSSGSSPSGSSPSSPSLAPRPATGRFEVPRPRKPVAYPPQRGSTANARIVNRRVGNVTVVSVTGKLAEGFKGRELARELSGVVVLDLLGVERVTSYGVREWLAFLEEAGARVSQLFMARCSEAIVAQLGMIRGFAGKAQILSVMAPYACSCGHPVNGLLDLRAHGKDIALGNVPSPQCPTCGRDDTEFDDDPRGYFVFQSDRAPQVPPEVDEALATLEARAVEAVEKTVDANTTRVTVNAELDGSIRWQRILDGIEGRLCIDLQRSPRTTIDGAQALVHALTHTLTANDAVELVAAPQEVLPILEAWPATGPHLTITSASVEGQCPDCNGGRRVLLPVAEHLEALRAGRDPVILCPRHSRPLDFAKVRPLFPALLPRSAPTTKAAEPTLAPPLPAPSRTTTPLPPAASPVASPVASTASPQGIPLGTAVGWGAAAVAITVAVVVAMRAPAPVPVAPPPLPATVAAPAAPPASSLVDDLPPEWTQRPLVIDDVAGEVFVVGKAGPARTKERLLALASDDAILRLVVQVERAARPTAPVLGDASDEVFRERVHKRFDDTFGIFASPTRTDVFITERPEGFSGAFRFKLSKAAYDKMVAQLDEVVAPLGVNTGRIRITEAVALSTSDALVVVPPKNGDADPTVRLGDTIHALNDEPVTDLQEFDLRLRTAYRNLAPGRSLSVVFGRGGALTEKRWRKPTETQ